MSGPCVTFRVTGSRLVPGCGVERTYSEHTVWITGGEIRHCGFGMSERFGCREEIVTRYEVSPDVDRRVVRHRGQRTLDNAVQYAERLAPSGVPTTRSSDLVRLFDARLQRVQAARERWGG